VSQKISPSAVIIQVAVVIGAAGVFAGVIVAIGVLTIPDPPPPFVSTGADSESLPTPDDLNEAGAVIVASGTPVDQGTIAARYELEGTPIMWEEPLNQEGADLRFGRGSVLRITWVWADGEAGGRVLDVQAALNLPGATFYARDGECEIDLTRYELDSEQVEVDFGIEMREVTIWVAAFAGSLNCQGVTGVGIEEPISYQAAFTLPRIELPFTDTFEG
jgi:hypothetical protein